ncbi:MAG: alpha/beta hydrolase [Deltaproteobacteria bacterium]|nr:alpha/beta hydrolase [Deltaproteobacteria bacterium]
MLVPKQIDDLLGPMDTGHLTVDDGTQLSYQCFGDPDGEAVVFANGIGVRYPGSARQVEALRGRYRIVCWDYRGIGQSVMPDPATGDVSMSRHARDILALLEQLEIERAVFIGWSMGVQVSLEAIRQQPERVAGLVALLGTCGKPFHNAFPGPVATAVEGLFTLLNRFPALAQGALDLGVSLPGLTHAVLSRGLFVGQDVDRDVFDTDVRSVAGVEKSLYTRTLLALSGHDAADVLPHVPCPALIIAGERDHLTPPRVARWMADTIPDAVYREVADGTHFALIEQPELINGWLLEFIDRVYPAAHAV